MPTFLRLQLENFKSYRLPTTIEWKQVSSILGQNGTGKSTIVDAVEYVFCFPRYSKKSVEFLRGELYHKHSKEDEHSCSWVSAVVNIGDEEREFKRSVDYNKSAHKYWIDDRAVDLKEYKKFLMRVNINPRANHFLVQQNSIESLALKNAKQRTDFFEILSSSVGYKREYDRLASDIKTMQMELKSLQSVLDLHCRERKNLIQKNKEIEIYDDLTEQLEKAEFNYYYIKLYKLKTNIDCLVEQEKEKQKHIRKCHRTVTTEYEVKIEQLKTAIAAKERQLKDLETELGGLDPKIKSYKRIKADLKEKMQLCVDEIINVNNNLQKAKDTDNAHQEALQKLRKDIDEFEKMNNEFNSSLSQSSSLELNDEQYENYLELKAKSRQLYVKDNQCYLSLERESDNIKDKIYEYKVKKKVLLNKVNKEKLILDNINTQKEKIKNKYEEINEAIENIQKELTKIQVNELRIEVERTINRIQDCNKQLNHLDMDQQESSSKKRQNEITDILMATFSPRVIGRLSRLCKVADKNYEIAITTALGSNMDVLVVDTASTARECIEFLKEKYRDDKYPAIVKCLPLNTCGQNRILPEHTLRKIESAPYAQLGINLMKTGQIGNILKDLLGNIVVCETDDQARKFAFSTNLNCVSRDGTYFKKDGTFSGGRSNIEEQAKKWDEEYYKKIQKGKRKHTETLRSLQQEIRDREIKRKELEMQLESLKRHVVYVESELKKYEKNLIEQKNVHEKSKNDLETFKSESQINELKKSLKYIQNQLEASKKREREIEDEVFSNFCKKFKLKDVREYEQVGAREHEERLKQRVDMDTHLDRMKNELKFQESRDTKATIVKFEKKLAQLIVKFVKLYFKKKDHKTYEKKHKRLVENETAIKGIRREIDKMTKAQEFEERKLEVATKHLRELQRSAETINSEINRNRRVKIHDLLKDCKVKGINIPLKQGTIEKVAIHSKILDTESESSGLQSESSSAIYEKNVEIDFSPLEESFQKFKGSKLEEELNKRLQSLQVEQANLRQKLQSCTPSNRDLNKELDSLKTKIAEAKKDVRTKQEQLKTIQDEFEEIKRKRTELLTKFCSSVEKEIDKIFKNLYNNDSAQACIVMANPDEPYLDGIGLSFLIPGKRFALMEHLSGGEKTMCAMALFLAIYSAKPAPCIIFDEIDAALDNANLQNIVNLFLKWKQTTQIISISHHECLLRCADSAIGINISARKNSSYAIHLDLTRYLNPVHVSSSLSQTTRTPIASPRQKSTSSSDKRTTGGVELPSLSSSSSRRSTTNDVGSPIHASTPTRTLAKPIIKSVEILQPRFVSRKRKADGLDEDDDE